MLSGLQRFYSAWQVRRDLDEAGFERPGRVRWGTWVVFWIVLALAAAAMLLSGWLAARRVQISGVELGRLLLAGGAAFIALEQWGAARQEISLDRFYDRLDRANKLLGECDDARALMNPDWRKREVYEPAMYACVELDNLEYAIEKYSLGYMTSRNAHRALRTFNSRCERSAGFRREVREALACHGYNRSTAAVARRVMAAVEVEEQTLATGSERLRDVTSRLAAARMVVPADPPKGNGGQG